MRQPWTMTCTDGDLVPLGEGKPHPRAYGAFARKMKRYVRERGTVDIAVRHPVDDVAARDGVRPEGPRPVAARRVCRRPGV